MLEERVERLSMICEAMWDLMAEQNDLDLEQLTAKLADISSSQVLLTQSALKDETTCPNCGNPKPAEASLCLFCSAGSR